MGLSTIQRSAYKVVFSHLRISEMSVGRMSRANGSIAGVSRRHAADESTRVEYGVTKRYITAQGIGQV